MKLSTMICAAARAGAIESLLRREAGGRLGGCQSRGCLYRIGTGLRTRATQCNRRTQLRQLGSAQLASQIEEGAPVDAFASTDVIHVEQLAQKGLIAKSAIFARNKLALIASK